MKFFTAPKNIAAIVLVILYFTNVFSYAVGYSGYGFTIAAMQDQFLYGILFIVPLASIYCLLSSLVKTNTHLFRLEKYAGFVLTGVFILISMIMFFEGSFRTLNFGFWLSFVCGLIITFDRHLRGGFIKPKNQN